MKHISLFTGIAGIDLAAEWAGFETVLMVENNAYCQKVLRKHWPNVPILEDIFDVNKETIQEALANTTHGALSSRGHCTTSDTEASRERQTDRARWGSINDRGGDRQESQSQSIPPITLLTGGFPCQPFSVAGKQRGKEDDRYLWPEMLRVIKEVRPRWVVAENVAGLIRMGLDDCISDLENIGYTVEPYLIPACAVNAPHRRDRIFIVGHSNRRRQLQSQGGISKLGERISNGSQDVADTQRIRCGNGGQRAFDKNGNSNDIGTKYGSWWSVEPGMGRVAHGIPSRVDRLKALGNAVVPQQIYPILKAIADIEGKL